jgi:hypothetical protein
MPDLLVHHRSWHGYLELKVGRNVVSDDQAHKIKEITDRWFPAFVLYPDRLENEKRMWLADTEADLLGVLIAVSLRCGYSVPTG